MLNQINFPNHSRLFLLFLLCLCMIFPSCKTSSGGSSSSRGKSTYKILQKAGSVQLVQKLSSERPSGYEHVNQYRLNPEKKKDRNTRPSLNLTSNPPVFSSESTLFYLKGNRLICWKPTSGKPSWSTKLDADGSQVLPLKKRLFLYQNEGTLKCLSTETGEQIWERNSLPEYGILTGSSNHAWIYNHQTLVSVKPASGNFALKRDYGSSNGNSNYRSKIERLIPVNGTFLLRRKPRMGNRFLIEVYDSKMGKHLYKKLGRVIGVERTRMYVHSFRDQRLDVMRIPVRSFESSIKLLDYSGEFLRVHNGTLFFSTDSFQPDAGADFPSHLSANKLRGKRGIVRADPITGTKNGFFPVQLDLRTTFEVRIQNNLLFVLLSGASGEGETSNIRRVDVWNVNNNKKIFSARYPGKIYDFGASNRYFYILDNNGTLYLYRR